MHQKANQFKGILSTVLLSLKFSVCQGTKPLNFSWPCFSGMCSCVDFWKISFQSISKITKIQKCKKAMFLTKLVPNPKLSFSIPYKSTLPLSPTLQLASVKHQIPPRACPVSSSSKHQLVSKLLRQGEKEFSEFGPQLRHFQSNVKIHSNP